MYRTLIRKHPTNDNFQRVNTTFWLRSLNFLRLYNRRILDE